MTPVRIGMLGIGQRGLQHLAELWNLQAAGAVRIVGLCDAWPDNLCAEKIRSFVPEYSPLSIQTFSSFQSMMSECEMDAVYFCLPRSVHDGEVIAAARAGLHVFVEKPMSLFLDEALQMDDAIRNAGVIGAAGFQQRYYDQNEAARDFLADKRLVMLSSSSHGSLESHSTKHTHTEEVGGPANRVWTANFAWSGSAVVEAGIHTVDLMRFWAGDIDWVQAAYVSRDPDDIENDGDNPYVSVVTLGFRCGAIGTLHFSKLRRVFRGTGEQLVLWDHGHLSFEPDGPVAYYYDGPYPPPAAPDPGQLRHPVPVEGSKSSMSGINQAFVDAVASGETAGLRSLFSQSMNSLFAVLAANASHSLNGERIGLAAFANHKKYASFRARPS